MPQWPVAATNSILVSGIPLEFEYEAYEDHIWPGMGVVIDTTNKWEAKLCTDGSNIVCIADISMASLSGRGSWRYDSGIHGNATSDGTDYTYHDGDQMKCISGSITVMLLLAPSQVITEGEKLQCVGSGLFGTYACLTTFNLAVDPCALVAEAMEAVTTQTVSQYIHAKLLI
jgi:hypothetical protein